MTKKTDQQRVFGDVKYEVNMMNATANALAKKAKAGLKNVLLESFLLHSKNIFEFLTLAKQNGNREILAVDYCDWYPSVGLAGMPTVARFAPKIEDYLLHLSYNRLKKKPNWPVGKILKEVNGAWRKFEKVNGR